eukprot:CAMPEP_0197567622 /NCGR_PEP_ID=MMETSP1320-20131121/35903_1 /TAXON_ID=91990 /ORGANISM="Bolidomonas sp., Strain RCC2347" /LENGTH=94 /DNA_ID=CAMNT_0043129833 /DNA_START=151 /DNA_END=436 /DNA_ORIENTATION=-
MEFGDEAKVCPEEVKSPSPWPLETSKLIVWSIFDTGAGETHTIEEEDKKLAATFMSLNLHVVSDLKLAPVTVTAVPPFALPLEGVSDVMDGDEV